MSILRLPSCGASRHRVARAHADVRAGGRGGRCRPRRPSWRMLRLPGAERCRQDHLHPPRARPDPADGGPRCGSWGTTWRPTGWPRSAKVGYLPGELGLFRRSPASGASTRSAALHPRPPAARDEPLASARARPRDAEPPRARVLAGHEAEARARGRAAARPAAGRPRRADERARPGHPGALLAGSQSAPPPAARSSSPATSWRRWRSSATVWPWSARAGSCWSAPSRRAAPCAHARGGDPVRRAGRPAPLRRPGAADVRVEGLRHRFSLAGDPRAASSPPSRRAPGRRRGDRAAQPRGRLPRPLPGRPTGREGPSTGWPGSAAHGDRGARGRLRPVRAGRRPLVCVGRPERHPPARGGASARPCGRWPARPTSPPRPATPDRATSTRSPRAPAAAAISMAAAPARDCEDGAAELILSRPIQPPRWLGAHALAMATALAAVVAGATSAAWPRSGGRRPRPGRPRPARARPARQLPLLPRRRRGRAARGGPGAHGRPGRSARRPPS